MTAIKFCIAQINPLVGDIHANTIKIINAGQQAINNQIDCIIFPELCLVGYPADDLLQRGELYQQIDQAKKTIGQQLKNIAVILGYPTQQDHLLYNTAGYYFQGKCQAEYHKQALPNDGVFDEKRYFSSGHNANIITIKNRKIGLSICEDLWAQPRQTHGEELVISINASPFSINKHQRRHTMLSQRARETGVPIAYINCVGGHDELIFDGGSMVVDPNGSIVLQSSWFTESLNTFTLDEHGEIKTTEALIQPLSRLERVYQALVLGLKDYVSKNHIKKVLIGLSGGIDSALTLAMAHDALGSAAITTVAMPSNYTANMSIEDAHTMAQQLNIDHRVIPIKNLFNTFKHDLKDYIGKDQSITQQNIQARIRGTILMTLSNQMGAMVLNTGNKSEMAVGYTTLYGDMIGGYAVLKDIYKTLVYELADYRNQISQVIPSQIIERPPSAELTANQVDQDTLPNYAELDELLEGYLEQDWSPQQLMEQGFAEDTIRPIIQMIQHSEHKRQQAPPGPKITEKAFGRDRRYPITSGFDSSYASSSD